MDKRNVSNIRSSSEALQHAPLIQSSDDDEDDQPGKNNPLDSVEINIPPEHVSLHKENIPQEPLKTLLAALFLGTGFLVTSFSLAFTHDRHPESEPLPDIVLDNMPYQHWGLDVSEYLLMISTLSAIFIVIFHKHRLIVLRRIWFLLGILYYYRALTFFVTVLPKADEEYECQPRSNDTSVMGMNMKFHNCRKLSLNIFNILDYVRRVIVISSGGGLSINGKHVFCGDYIFSGHTMTLTMGYLAINQCKLSQSMSTQQIYISFSRLTKELQTASLGLVPGVAEWSGVPAPGPGSLHH